MVHDGAHAGDTTMPARHGVLFDPDRYPFLEGRPSAGGRQIHERIEPPLVPDGTIHRVLEKLLVLDGERLSYRALDVEQIGSVYETMMGFRLELAHRPLARDQGAEVIRRTDHRQPGGAARGRSRQARQVAPGQRRRAS